MGKYTADSEELLKLVGGKENIAAVSHCMTRMRFVIADPKKADVKKIEAMKVVKGSFTQAGQFQVIIGNTVSEFYKDFTAVAGIEGVSKDAVKAAAGANQNVLQRAAAIHFMRGTPYIYQGEELGITNAKYTSIEQYRDVESLNYYKILLEQGKSETEALKIIGERSRDNGRTPMQWSAEKFAGFSNVEPWISSPDNFTRFNVEVEERDENSVLNFYKQLVRLRKSKKIISDGAIDFLERDNPNVLAYCRKLGEEELIVLCNFCGVESMLTEKTLLQYFAQGYKKILGNYAGLAENLRPFEFIVLEK